MPCCWSCWQSDLNTRCSTFSRSHWCQAFPHYCAISLRSKTSSFVFWLIAFIISSRTCDIHPSLPRSLLNIFNHLFTTHTHSTLPSSRGIPSPTTALVGPRPLATLCDIASSSLPWFLLPPRFVFVDHCCHDQWASGLACWVYPFTFQYNKHEQQQKASRLSRFSLSKCYRSGKTHGTRTWEGLLAEDCLWLVHLGCRWVF